MSKVTRTEIEVAVDHPLEEIFDIEEGSTLMPQVVRSTEIIPTESYDEKDNEIEGQFGEIYDAAMGAFESQMQEAEVVEGKYKARIGEIAVQFLNAGLAAAQAKSQLKQHKDKVVIKQNSRSGAKTVNNNLIVASQAEMLDRLESMMGKKSDDIP